MQAAPFIRDGRDKYSEHNQTMVVRFFKEVLGGANVEAADELIYPDIIIHAVGTPHAWLNGREGIKESAKALHKAFSSVEFNLDSIIVVRGKVEVKWTMFGVHKREFLGQRPTDQMSRMTGTSLFILQPSGPGAMIAEYWNNWDQWGLVQRLVIEPIESKKAVT